MERDPFSPDYDPDFEGLILQMVSGSQEKDWDSAVDALDELKKKGVSDLSILNGLGTVDQGYHNESADLNEDIDLAIKFLAMNSKDKAIQNLAMLPDSTEIIATDIWSNQKKKRPNGPYGNAA